MRKSITTLRETQTPHSMCTSIQFVRKLVDDDDVFVELIGISGTSKTIQFQVSFFFQSIIDAGLVGSKMM
jgi:hypothetical protein